MGYTEVPTHRYWEEIRQQDFKDTLEEYGVQHLTTPPYHPQANPVERSNRVLKTIIATFVGEDHRDWDKHVHEFRHAVNTAVQSTTKMSPAFLNFGRQPHPVKSLRREVEREEEVQRLDPQIWACRMRRLDALRDLVAKFIDEGRVRQIKYYNRNKRKASFNVGDLVLCRTHKLSNAAQRFTAKLAPKYEGPYEILSKLSPTVYQLKVDNNRKIAKIHVSDIKRFIPARGSK